MAIIGGYEDMRKVERIVDLIIKDMCDRSGFQQAWEECDRDTQLEIRNEWCDIILRIDLK